MLKNVPAEEIVLDVSEDGFRFKRKKLKGVWLIQDEVTADPTRDIGWKWSIGITETGRLWVYSYKGEIIYGSTTVSGKNNYLVNGLFLDFYASFAEAQRSGLIPNDILNMARRIKRRMAA